MADGLGRGAEPDGAAALRAAAEEAGQAPSILNTQPWRWRIHGGEMDLYADQTRRVGAADPDSRLLTVSCGVALHHARVALAAAGHMPAVARSPDPDDADLLARIRLAGSHAVREEDVAGQRAIRRRHSDRRPFPATAPVPADALAALHAAAAAEGAWLHQVGPEQVRFLIMAAEDAASVQAGDETYRADLHERTGRRRAPGEGVPPETVVSPTQRQVPLRDLTLEGESVLDPGFGDDQYAVYLILGTDGDRTADRLRAGEAVSAVWLTATTRDLAVSAMSDVVERPDARTLLAGLLPQRGYPQLVPRVGVDMQQRPPPASPRRRPASMIDTE